MQEWQRRAVRFFFFFFFFFFFQTKKKDSVASPALTRARSSTRFGSFRRKIFGGAEEDAVSSSSSSNPVADSAASSPVMSKRSSVFGLSGLARKTKEAQESAVSSDAMSSSSSVSIAPSAVAVEEKTSSAGGTPVLGRTRRSLSVANLRDRLTGKSSASSSDHRKSIDPSGSSDVVPSLVKAEQTAGTRSRAGSKDENALLATGGTTSNISSPGSAQKTPEPKKTLSRPGEDREALINALSSCVTNLARALGSSSKASRLLGGARPRASSTHQAGETSAVLEAAVALGNSIATLTSKLDTSGAPGLVREVLGRYKALEEAIIPLTEKADDWREVLFCFFFFFLDVCICARKKVLFCLKRTFKRLRNVLGLAC